MSRRHWYILIVILAAASYLRIVHLGEPSFWVDEMNHVFAGISLAKGEEAVLPSGFPNDRALLFSAAVSWSFKTLGVSEFAARLPSALFGILSVAMVFWIGRELFSVRAGLISAFVLTFTHAAIGWSRTARMYALFQLTYLVAVFLFYKGYEGLGQKKEGEPGKGMGIRKAFRKIGISPSWLFMSGIFFVISYSLHQLAALFILVLTVYSATAAVAAYFSGKTDGWRLAKYVAVITGVLISVGVAIARFDFLTFVDRAIKFIPAWANYDLVKDSHYYYWYLTDSVQFPLAAFFLIGSIQVFTRLHRAGFFLLLNFLIPIMLFSFVFSYRIPNYIFHVLPFYTMLIAFSLDNLFTTEGAAFRRNINFLGRIPEGTRMKVLSRVVPILVLGWLPLTVWFRYATKLPQRSYAGSNGAVEHFDWRGASDYVRRKMEANDVLVTSLPLTMLYYLGKADYNLNNANLDPTLDWESRPGNGDLRDYYSGAPSIMSVEQFEELLSRAPRGWLVVDSYRLSRPQYIPDDVREFIETRLIECWSDARRTVRVFSWNIQSGDS